MDAHPHKVVIKDKNMGSLLEFPKIMSYNYRGLDN